MALQSVSAALARDAAAIATFGITLTIIFDCVMTFFGSLSNDSCFNAWMTDVTDDTNRGKVEGVNSAMPLLAMLAVFGGAMFLMIVNEDGTVTYNYPLFFTIIGALVLIVGVLTLFLMEDSQPAAKRDGNYLADVIYGFKPASMSQNKMLYLVLGGYCVFSTALQVFMPYYVLYLRLPYILGESYVFVMALGIIIAAIFTIFYGRMVDRHGFLRAALLPLVIFLAGCVMLTFLTSMAGVFAGSVLMLCGYLGACACFGAKVRNNTPLDRVGLFQGVRIFMVVLIPMLIGPWIGSTISASSSSMVGFGVVGDGFTPSSLIFLGGAAVALQFFGMALRLAQELSYLYGADDIWKGGAVDEEKVKGQLILYCGVMFGVSGAVSGVRVLSSQIAKTTLKKLPQKALTKTFWYPMVKQIGKAVGIKITKNTVAKGASKAIPVLGGVL